MNQAMCSEQFSLNPGMPYSKVREVWWAVTWYVMTPFFLTISLLSLPLPILNCRHNCCLHQISVSPLFVCLIVNLFPSKSLFAMLWSPTYPTPTLPRFFSPRSHQSSALSLSFPPFPPSHRLSPSSVRCQDKKRHYYVPWHRARGKNQVIFP